MCDATFPTSTLNYEVRLSHALLAQRGLDSLASPLFLVYLPDLSVLGAITEFVPSGPPDDAAKKNVYFDVDTQSFRTEADAEDRAATWSESARYCEVHAAAGLSVDALRLRILEMSYGFIPSFQYQVERFYRAHFKEVVAQMEPADEAFRGKERKAEFSRLFKSEIFPRLSEHGFERDGRATRMVRRTAELEIFIDFSHISFGFGSYQVSLIWMENPDATLDDESLIGRLELHFPFHSNLMIVSQNEQILAYSVQEWLRVFDLYLKKYISNNLTMDSVGTWLDRDQSLRADKESLELPLRSPRHAYILSK
jgi:hypothetical protein